jgi:hypothetical protein
LEIDGHSLIFDYGEKLLSLFALVFVSLHFLMRSSMITDRVVGGPPLDVQADVLRPHMDEIIIPNNVAYLYVTAKWSSARLSL